MEETKIIEMNDEALEVAEEFVDESIGGKVLVGTVLTIALGVATYLVVKHVKKKIAAKEASKVTEPIEVEHAEVAEDDNSEEI